MPLLLAEELDALTTKTFEDWETQLEGKSSGTHISIIDKHNLTFERLHRLQRLLQKDPDGSTRPEDNVHAVRADELCAKLCAIANHSPSNDTASTASTAGADLTEEDKNYNLQRVVQSRLAALERIGGSIHCNNISREQKLEVRESWRVEACCAKEELEQWLDFRWYQFEIRTHQKTRDIHQRNFRACQDMIHVRDVALPLHQQSKLDEWIEYYVFIFGQCKIREDHIAQMMDKKLKPLQQWIQATEGLPDVSDHALEEELPRLVVYNKEKSLADERFRLARLRKSALVKLHLPRSENYTMALEAQEELDKAENQLNATTSAELEQLGKQFERRRCQTLLAKAEDLVGITTKALSRLNTSLKRIGEQFERISNIGVSIVRPDQALMNGWAETYSYLTLKHSPRTKGVPEVLTSEGWAAKHEVALFEMFLAWIKQEISQSSSKSESYSNSGFSQEQECQENRLHRTRQRSKPSIPRSPLAQHQPLKIIKRSCVKKARLCAGPMPDPSYRDSTGLRRSKRIQARGKGTALVSTAHEPAVLPLPVRRISRISEQTSKLVSTNINPISFTKHLALPQAAEPRRLVKNSKPQGIVKRKRRKLKT